MKRIIIGAIIPTLFYILVRYGLNFLAPGVLPDFEVILIASVILAVVLSSLLHLGSFSQLAAGFNLAWLAIIAHSLWFQPAIRQDKILLGTILFWFLYSLVLLLHYFLMVFSQEEKKKLLITSGPIFLIAFGCLLSAQYFIF